METIKTPRGTFKIQDKFDNSKEAKENNYHFYFSYNEVDIHTKHISEYCCEFAIVRRS